MAFTPVGIVLGIGIALLTSPSAKNMIDVTEKEKAGVSRRFVSFLIDTAILNIVELVGFLIGMNLILQTTPIEWFVDLVIKIGYFTYLFGRGQTLGMMAMRIKLTRTDGTYPIGYARGLLRYVGMIISGLAIGIGYLWIIPDKDHHKDGMIRLRIRM